MEEKKKTPVALREEEILKFWQEQKIFEQSVQKPAGKDPVGEFVFYDGPPFATGLPHYGHVLPGTIKDVIPRYKTMNGLRVTRRWGWDCHGLPIENLIEKELGLKVKKDIEEYGIERFNAAARESVLRYTDDWKRLIPRVGRWVDMENDYRTMDPSYTESIWWAFKTLYDRGLLYEGYKSMHLCPRCETTLANFEVNQGYKDITDISVTVELELLDEPKTFLLAWTTTPWTLPGNVAAAVNPDVDYAYVTGTEAGNTYIVARERVEAVFEGEHAIVRTVKGKELVGKKYKSLFSYYTQDASIKNKENGWAVYPAPFVTTEDGTGVVHIAPAFGEDDMNLAKEFNLPFIQHVGTDGRMKLEVADFAGLSAKPIHDHESTDVAIMKYLAREGTLFSKKKIVHSYPHCWRCDTPLLNYAATSWFVKVTAFKDDLIANNKKTNWVPDHLRDGRFGKWLEGARDWSISRSRFWGAPLPVWRCESCKELKVIGAAEELARETARSENKYFIMRHGQADSNTKGVVSARVDDPNHLTDEGRRQVEKTAHELAGQGIDLIFSSDFVRTRETAEIAAQTLGISSSDIVYEQRLREVDTGNFHGKPVAEYHKFLAAFDEFTEVPPGSSENLTDLKNRMAEFLYELDQKYSGKKILIVSHEYPLWLLSAAAVGQNMQGTMKMKFGLDEFVENGEARLLSFAPISHNKNYELDYHRPFIDAVSLNCACGGVMKRVPEVFDCWFESGSMPFASVHYPFENKDWYESHSPADFIAEGLDQTRGWFYSLMVLSTALFGKPTFRQVVVNGLVLAEDGQKMAKRLKNYPELDHVLDTYGADALRYYLINSPAVHAEDLNFSEKGVGEVSNKVIGRLGNVLVFYEQNKGSAGSPSTTLDEWIMSRLAELVRDVTEALEHYELDKATRPIASFIEDFSVWYIRRSRKNFSPQTSRTVLAVLARVMAPFTPFLAEHIWRTVRSDADAESVHLTSWPKSGFVDDVLLQKMKSTRNIVEHALAERAKNAIKVRQPLAALFVDDQAPDFFEDLVCDEVNVKKVAREAGLGDGVRLDMVITPELEMEGRLRDLVRLIQDKRKEAGLLPNQEIVLSLGKEYADLVTRFGDEIKNAVHAVEIKTGDDIEIVRV